MDRAASDLQDSTVTAIPRTSMGMRTQHAALRPLTCSVAANKREKNTKKKKKKKKNI